MSLISHSTLKHLRITFSFNLLPIFLFGLVITPQSINWIDALVLFLCWHFFIYPASNGFNSYFDKDKESIAGIKYPPKVTKELYFSSITLDGIGILLALCKDLPTAISVLIYGLIKKEAYSQLDHSICFSGVFRIFSHLLGHTRYTYIDTCYVYDSNSCITNHYDAYECLSHYTSIST